MDIGTQLKEQVAQLEQAILAAHPTLPVLLQTIHKQLKADPQLVTVLSDEDIGVIVTGLKRHTQVEIAAKIVKGASSAAAKKKLSSTTVDDL